MAVFIKTEKKETVILDPQSDDDLMIKLYSQPPNLVVRKATNEEVKCLLESINTTPSGRSFT